MWCGALICCNWFQFKTEPIQYDSKEFKRESDLLLRPLTLAWQLNGGQHAKTIIELRSINGQFFIRVFHLECVRTVANRSIFPFLAMIIINAWLVSTI